MFDSGITQFAAQLERREDQTVPSRSPPYPSLSPLHQDISESHLVLKTYTNPFRESQQVTDLQSLGQSVQVEKVYNKDIDQSELEQSLIARLEEMDGIEDFFGLESEKEELNSSEAPEQFSATLSGQILGPEFSNLENVQKEFEIYESGGGSNEFQKILMNQSGRTEEKILAEETCYRQNDGVNEIVQPSYETLQNVTTNNQDFNNNGTKGGNEQSATDLFNQIQGIGQSISYDDMKSDPASYPDVSFPPDLLFGLEQVKQELNSDGSFGSDSDLEALCSDLDFDSSYSNSTNEVAAPLMEDVVMLELEHSGDHAVYEQTIDPTSTMLPKFPELLGDNTPTRNINHEQPTPNIRSTRSSSGRGAKAKDPEWVSAPNDDGSDEDFVPYVGKASRKKRQAPFRRGNEHLPPVTPKRSRRKSPKLWVFLLDSLCDPRLNPSVICWHNKGRGTFKIQDTKKLPDLWGCRLGKTVKGGAKHNMNYEKFSRAIRYYYKNKVLNSTSGRLTYQFGPNATGWRARAENNGA